MEKRIVQSANGIAWDDEEATARVLASKEPKVLNRIMKNLVTSHQFPSVTHLKELLGHTRKEVCWGMVTGVCVALAVCSLWPARFS